MRHHHHSTFTEARHFLKLSLIQKLRLVTLPPIQFGLLVIHGANIIELLLINLFHVRILSVSSHQGEWSLGILGDRIQLWSHNLLLLLGEH